MASLGVFWAAVMVAACSSCKKGSDTTTLGFSKCIEDWPTSGGPHPITASLQVEAPKLLWAIDVAGSQAMSGRISSGDGGPVLAGNRLAFQAGDFVYFVNKDGSDPQQARLASSGYPSGLAADLAGNVYTVAQDGVFSIDAAGKMRWQGGGAGQTQGELTYYNPPVLGPDGVVYAVASNQRVYALRTADGSTLWSQPAPTVGVLRSQALGGAGAGLFVAIGGQRIDVLVSGTGQTIGTLRARIDGSPEEVTSQWGGWVLGWYIGIALGTDWVFDSCGTLRWSMYDSSTYYGGAGMLAPGDLLVAARRSIAFWPIRPPSKSCGVSTLAATSVRA
jgi:hypothetical protein